VVALFNSVLIRGELFSGLVDNEDFVREIYSIEEHQELIKFLLKFTHLLEYSLYFGDSLRRGYVEVLFYFRVLLPEVLEVLLDSLFFGLLFYDEALILHFVNLFALFFKFL
jgi:hypothetical protein